MEAGGREVVRNAQGSFVWLSQQDDSDEASWLL